MLVKSHNIVLVKSHNIVLVKSHNIVLVKSHIVLVKSHNIVLNHEMSCKIGLLIIHNPLRALLNRTRLDHHQTTNS